MAVDTKLLVLEQIVKCYSLILIIAQDAGMCTGDIESTIHYSVEVNIFSSILLQSKITLELET